MMVGEGVVSQHWRWARIDQDGEVKSAVGFYTIAAAVHDARQHGFDGSADTGDLDFLRGGYDADRWVFRPCAA